MQDEPPVTGTTEEQPQTARARPWIHTPTEDRDPADHPRVSLYEASARIARDARYVRARLAASKTIQLAHHLADDDQPAHPEGDPMWTVRGQNRRRDTFALPHPEDFTGTGNRPREFPHLLSGTPLKVNAAVHRIQA